MKKIEWFSAFRYVVPAQYEKWFEEKSIKGWHPKKIGQWSSLAMTFYKGEPKKYKYCVDLQAKRRKDYQSIYTDFGWEYVGQMASMHLWRKEYADKKPESFTDKDSMARRNKRFVYAVLVSFVIFLITFIVTTVNLVLTLLGMTQFKTTSDILANGVLPVVLSGGFMWYLGYVMRKINMFRE